MAAPAEVVFDLSRHIGLHKESMSAYKEEAVAGTRMGLIGKDETVTWRARHFYKDRLLRMKVTDMQSPDRYTTEQLQGDFRSLRHEHYFKPCENGTIVIDILQYELPYGWLGRLFNRFLLGPYLKQLLEQRNRLIRESAEGGLWKKLLVN